MSAPESASALAGQLLQQPGGASELSLAERPAALTLVAARRGHEAHVDMVLRELLGLGLPRAGQTLVAGDCVALCTSPGNALIEGPTPRLAALRSSLRRNAAAIVDQCGGFAILRLSGPKAPVVLAKGCRLDLHPSAFRPGHCARTPVAQITVIMRQVDAAPSYDLVAPRTLARSFAEFLIRSARASGISISASLKPEETRTC